MIYVKSKLSQSLKEHNRQSSGLLRVKLLWIRHRTNGPVLVKDPVALYGTLVR
jgi:hypothetical protein